VHIKIILNMEGFLNPPEILGNIALKENMIVADFGCGSGGWVLPLAKRLGEESRIYAIDVLVEPLSALKGKADSEQITNIILLRADVESEAGSKVPENSCDLVLLTNLLFQVQNKERTILGAKKVLKPGGKILIVDWDKSSPFGPKEAGISPEQAKKLAQEAELKVLQEFRAGIYHWALVLEKST